jgi:hypothetical protein
MNKSIMRACGFSKEVEAVEQGKCPICDKVINQSEFKDELSRKEFTISGMCQVCQDKTFEVHN